MKRHIARLVVLHAARLGGHPDQPHTLTADHVASAQVRQFPNARPGAPRQPGDPAPRRAVLGRQPSGDRLQREPEDLSGPGVCIALPPQPGGPGHLDPDPGHGVPGDPLVPRRPRAGRSHRRDIGVPVVPLPRSDATSRSFQARHHSSVRSRISGTSPATISMMGRQRLIVAGVSPDSAANVSKMSRSW